MLTVNGLGWFSWLVVGALAGWFATAVLWSRRQLGLLFGVVLGILGASLGGIIFTAVRFSASTEFRAFPVAGLFPAVTGFSVFAAYNVARFGIWSETGYWSRPFLTPLLRGLDVCLLSPERGLLWYSPALVLVPLGIAVAWRRARGCASKARMSGASGGSTKSRTCAWSHPSGHASFRFASRGDGMTCSGAPAPPTARRRT